MVPRSGTTTYDIISMSPKYPKAFKYAAKYVFVAFAPTCRLTYMILFLY